MTGSKRQYDRRRVLYLAGVVGASALAGCTDDSANDGGTEDDDTGTGQSGDDGSEAGSNGGGGDNGGDGDSDDGSGGDGANGDDGSEDDTDGEETGGDGDDGSEDDTDGEENGGDGTDEDEGTADESDDGPRLRDVFAFEQSYVMEFDTADGTGTWRFHEGNSYFEGTFGGERTEMYRISTESGVDTYTVSGDQCFKTSVEFEQDDVFDPQQPEADSEEYYASGKTTVEGQDAYVFDVNDGTYYVSVDTGYPVRFESQEGDVVSFHSWGETEPISPPEGECREL